jgi:hypothetical protein
MTEPTNYVPHEPAIHGMRWVKQAFDALAGEQVPEELRQLVEVVLPLLIAEMERASDQGELDLLLRIFHRLVTEQFLTVDALSSRARAKVTRELQSLSELVEAAKLRSRAASYTPPATEEIEAQLQQMNTSLAQSAASLALVAAAFGSLDVSTLVKSVLAIEATVQHATVRFLGVNAASISRS